MPDSKLPPMATPRIAAGALIRDTVGHVLLVRPTYKDGWDLPGGYVEPGESPAAACARELREEIGLQLTPGQLLVVDWAPHPTEGDKLLFVFDGGTLSSDTEVIPDGDEIAEARFHDRDTLASLMPDRLSRRVRSALDVLTRGVGSYAEHGVLHALSGPHSGVTA